MTVSYKKRSNNVIPTAHAKVKANVEWPSGFTQMVGTFYTHVEL